MFNFSNVRIAMINEYLSTYIHSYYALSYLNILPELRLVILNLQCDELLKQLNMMIKDECYCLTALMIGAMAYQRWIRNALILFPSSHVLTPFINDMMKIKKSQVLSYEEYTNNEKMNKELLKYKDEIILQTYNKIYLSDYLYMQFKNALKMDNKYKKYLEIF
jgi:hypothetical protein